MALAVCGSRAADEGLLLLAQAGWRVFPAVLGGVPHLYRTTAAVIVVGFRAGVDWFGGRYQENPEQLKRLTAYSLWIGGLENIQTFP